MACMLSFFSALNDELKTFYISSHCMVTDSEKTMAYINSDASIRSRDRRRESGVLIRQKGSQESNMKADF